MAAEVFSHHRPWRRRTWVMTAGMVMALAAGVHAATLTVGHSGKESFASLGAACKAAGPGDTIVVRAGVYHEELVIGSGQGGTPDRPIVIKADPRAPAGSVVLDGARKIPAEQWSRFVSDRFGVTAAHNIWCARHDPDRDAEGWELAVSAWPYKLYPGGTQFSIGNARLVRYGTCHLFKDGKELVLVPDRKDAGLMSDKYHADAEETQSHDYITAGNAKFLKPDQWIWYDAGRTDGSDEDDEPVCHPPELQNRIFVRLPAGQRPADVELAISMKSSLIRLEGAHDIIIEGLSLLRADHTAVSVSRSRHITLRNLTVRYFGGGRKFYYGAGTGQYMWDYGVGINLHSSDVVVSNCLVEQGTGKAISAWGQGPQSSSFVRIADSTIRNIGPHRWGGTWAHGRGSGIGLGNLGAATVEGNHVYGVSNCGIWVDGGGADRNIRIMYNRFTNCGGYGIFLEAGIAGALAAYNIVEHSNAGFRVGRDGAHCRVIGNLFVDCKSGGDLKTYAGEMAGHPNTVSEFVLAGNVFADCGLVGLKVSSHALNSRRLFLDCNVWHLGERANPAKAFGDVWGEGEGPRGTPRGGMSFEQYRKWLADSGSCLAAEEHSRLVDATPVKRLKNGRYVVSPPLSQLVSAELLAALEGHGLLSDEEGKLLAAGPRRLPLPRP